MIKVPVKRSQYRTLAEMVYDGAGSRLQTAAYLGGLTVGVVTYTLDVARGGLLYINGRCFDPTSGRFLSPGKGNFDPKRPGTLNGYLAVLFLANPC